MQGGGDPLSRRLAGVAIHREVFSEEEIRARVRELGAEITAAFPEGDSVLLIGLLKGSVLFLADLARAIDLPVQVDFLVASSYGSGTTSSGNVRLVYDPETDLAGRHVIIVEDIVDSGTTLNRLVPLLATRSPRSLEICALLHKRLTSLDREPRWVGFDAPQEFLVGYGLDYAENLRHLPFIASIRAPEEGRD